MKKISILFFLLVIAKISNSQSWQSINSAGGSSGIIQGKQIHFSLGQAISGSTINPAQNQQGFQYLYWNSNVSVNDVSNLDLTIYPNPATDIINIRSESTFKGKLEVHSMSGQLLKSMVLDSNESQVQVDDLQKGTYLLSFTQNHLIYKKIIIIQ